MTPHRQTPWASLFLLVVYALATWRLELTLQSLRPPRVRIRVQLLTPRLVVQPVSPAGGYMLPPPLARRLTASAIYALLRIGHLHQLSSRLVPTRTTTNPRILHRLLTRLRLGQDHVQPQKLNGCLAGLLVLAANRHAGVIPLRRPSRRSPCLMTISPSGSFASHRTATAPQA